MNPEMNPKMKTKMSMAELLAKRKEIQIQRGQELEEQQRQKAPKPKKTLLELLEERKQQQQQPKAELESAPQQVVAAKLETFSLDIVLNDRQILAKEMAFAGKSFCLVGAAGTGKTTAQREIAIELLKSNKLSIHEFRIQGSGTHACAPSIGLIAHTRTASGNLERAIHKNPVLKNQLRYNITTGHNLLEYSPETYWDPIERKEKFHFAPKKDRNHPLDITHLVIEEASMMGLDLGQKLMDALRCGIQIIYVGDINQLPPVFGDSVLNYALVQLPVIELTQVYRQEENSTIVENAHRILRGEFPVEAPDFKIITGGTIQHTQAKLAQTLGVQFPAWKDKGIYDPEQDIILSPWNKQPLGTDNLNNWIAQRLGEERKAMVYEVRAGIAKHYLAVGDKVMVNKRVGYITRIANNGRYWGSPTLPASVTLTRFGAYNGASEEENSLEEIDYSHLNLDAMMNEKEEDIKREASHVINIMLDTGEESTLSMAGDFSPNTFSLAYALTVHKAQGCEWRKVFIILHRDHAVSLYRELLYTAITRAREQVIIIAKKHIIEKAIKCQRIKGNSIEEKIAFFNSGAKLQVNFNCTK